MKLPAVPTVRVGVIHSKQVPVTPMKQAPIMPSGLMAGSPVSIKPNRSNALFSAFRKKTPKKQDSFYTAGF